MNERVDSVFLEILTTALADFGFSVTSDGGEALAGHFAWMMKANRSLNLTAVTDPIEAAAKHYCDSVAVARVLDRIDGNSRSWPGSQPPRKDEDSGRGDGGGESDSGGFRQADSLSREAGRQQEPSENSRCKRAADVGSGAGFPGIPLAIVRPDWEWTLIEAKEKKVAFLENVAEALGLRNVSVERGRSEDLGRRPAFRDTFDLVVGRAIAPLGVVAELLLPLARPGGVAVAMKGPETPLSSEADEALERMGATAPEIIGYNLPGGMGRRTLAVFEKTVATPDEFPRRAGMASKRPLF